MANVTEDQLRDMPEYNEEGYESTAGSESSLPSSSGMMRSALGQEFGV